MKIIANAVFGAFVADPVADMTTEAIIFMASVWVVVICSMGYCFFKILISKKAFGLDDETPDHLMETPMGDFLEDPEHADKVHPGEPPQRWTNEPGSDEYREGEPPQD